MRPKDRDWAGSVQQTEVFFHQFIAYIFHTSEGRRMRGPFLRETLIRTITYTIGAIPPILILWYYKLITNNSTFVNLAVAILIFDLAFGVAFLRTVYKYRHRVKMVYHLYFGNEQQQVEQPQEIPPDADLDSLLSQMSANEPPPAPVNPDSSTETVYGNDAIDVQVTFECTRCRCQVICPVNEAETTKTCPCGGELVEL